MKKVNELSRQVDEAYKTKSEGNPQTPNVKREYKDTVFRLLFSDREKALSLYNGVNGTKYHDASMLQYNTLENAIYMNVHNDISFVIANRIQMYEHQSTVPVNMPLRDLFYIADILQKTVADKTIYGSKPLMIPNPNFIVFYNGRDKMPERMEMKLSDNFSIPTDSPELELKVTVLNINDGMNEQLKRKCPELKQYMQYVDKVRNYNKELELKDAVMRAVDECIREGILRDFLIKQKGEVIKMSIYEFDEEREMKLIRECEREIGEENGESRIRALNKHLLSDNRMEDLRRASEDAAYCKALCLEYNL